MPQSTQPSAHYGVTKWHPFGWGARNFLLGLIAFTGACAGIHELLPMPFVPGVAVKLERLQQIGHEVTTLFIGSSLVQRQIDPTLFDSIVSDNGTRSMSFNLAADGMLPLEAEYLLRKTCGALPALRWVFLEANGISLEARQGDTIRGEYWRDLTQTTPILKSLLERVLQRRTEGKAPAKERVWRQRKITPAKGSSFQRRIAAVRRMAHHAALMCRNYSNLGRGLALLRSPARIANDELHSDPRWRNTGFYSVDRTLTPAEGELLRKWVEWSSHPQVRQLRSEVHVEVLQRIAARLRLRGVTTILIVSPDAAVDRGPREIAVASGLPLLAFDRPDEYPTLYEPDHRYDVRHLNSKGAEEFTRLIATGFLRLIRDSE